jgi:GNAT superfamily N-acetyltransferase
MNEHVCDCMLSDDYGEIVVEKLTSGQDFWSLVNEMLDDDGPSPVRNKNTLIEAYRDGRMYFLKVRETDDMYKRGAGKDVVFSHPCMSRYVLPCVAIMSGDSCEWLWVAPRLRGLGLGRKLVEFLKPTSTSPQLDASKGFWIKFGLNDSYNHTHI